MDLTLHLISMGAAKVEFCEQLKVIYVTCRAAFVVDTSDDHAANQNPRTPQQPGGRISHYGRAWPTFYKPNANLHRGHATVVIVPMTSTITKPTCCDRSRTF